MLFALSGSVHKMLLQSHNSIMRCAHITGKVMELSQPVPHNNIAVPHEWNTAKNAIEGSKNRKWNTMYL